VLLGTALGLGCALGALARWLRSESLHGRVVLITGSSRGLGLALAEAFARQGAQLILCAREAEPLELARQRLAKRGTEALAIPCDVRDREQVQHLIEQGIAHFGRIDILVNNAGIIAVGPARAMTLEDYERSMDTMFWGTVYTTLAVLPSMRARREGKIVNITSIGGKVSVPHLLPYSCAKFAAVGFSEGLHAELAKEGIKVTTVVPGLMRTGSHLRAEMKGQRRQEYTLFGLLATLPFTATRAAHAARRIVSATRRGAAEIIITPQAQLMGRLHGLFPATTVRLFSLVDRFLPRANETECEGLSGQESRSPLGSWLTRLGEPAAHTYNQYAGQAEGRTR
jgi:NAD(P)-dependent dehydrogenase (short-subunit alcohol dehydrogenase family)